MKCDTIPDLERFLQIQEQALGPASAEVAATTYKLAELYKSASQLDKAEALFRHALKIRQNLAGWYKEEIVECERSLDQLLKAKASQGGAPESIISGSNYNRLPVSHVNPSTPSNLLSDTPSDSGKFKGNQAKKIMDAIREAETELELLKEMVGPGHATVADMLTKIADLYCRLRMYAEMESILVEALKIREAICGSEHLSVATELKNLGRLYLVQERYALAEPLLKRALHIRERTLGSDHPRVLDIEEHYANLLRRTNRGEQADAIEQHIKEGRASLSGSNAIAGQQKPTVRFYVP